MRGVGRSRAPAASFPIRFRGDGRQASVGTVGICRRMLFHRGNCPVPPVNTRPPAASPPERRWARNAAAIAGLMRPATHRPPPRTKPCRGVLARVACYRILGRDLPMKPVWMRVGIALGAAIALDARAQSMAVVGSGFCEQPSAGPEIRRFREALTHRAAAVQSEQATASALGGVSTSSLAELERVLDGASKDFDHLAYEQVAETLQHANLETTRR